MLKQFMYGLALLMVVNTCAVTFAQEEPRRIFISINGLILDLETPEEDVDYIKMNMSIYNHMGGSEDIAKYTEEFDRWVARAKEIAGDGADVRKVVDAVNKVVWEEKQIKPDVRTAFEYLANFSAITVLKDKTGTCFPLTVLYLGMLSRLGLEVRPGRCPVHVFVQVKEGDKWINVDAANGGVIKPDEYFTKELLPPEHKNLKISWMTKREFVAATIMQACAVANQTSILEEVRKRHPKLPELDANLANSYLTDKDTQKALEAAQRATENWPELASNWEYLGNAYARNGMQDKAIEAYKKAIDIYPDSAGANLELGQIMEDLKRRDEADKYYLAGVAGIKYCYSAADLNNLGARLSQRKHLKEAKECLMRAYTLGQHSMEVLLNLSAVLGELGESKQAKEVLKAMMEVAPDHPGILNNLAWELATSHDVGVRSPLAAIELAKKALSLTKPEEEHYPFVLDTLAAAYAESGDCKSAFENEKEALRLIPKDDPQRSDYARRYVLFLGFATSGAVLEKGIDTGLDKITGDKARDVLLEEMKKTTDEDLLAALSEALKKSFAVEPAEKKTLQPVTVP